MTIDSLYVPTDTVSARIEIDPDTGIVRTTSTQEPGGHLSTVGRVRVGSTKPHYGIITGAITGGVTNTVTFQTPLPPDSLRAGWWATVLDSTVAEDSVQVSTLALDPASGNITGCTVSGTFAWSHNAGMTLYWEPGLHGNTGHAIEGHYTPPAYAGDPRSGAGVRLRPEGNAPHTLFMPDGSILGPNGQIADSSGRAASVAPLALTAGEFAKGLERQGFVLFDAGTYSSTTQNVDLYNNGVHTTMGPNSASFYGGAPGASQQSSWVTSPAGMADEILQLTAQGGTSTARWSDSQILDEDGTARSFTVTADTSFEFPVYVASTGTQYLGSHATMTQASAATTAKLYLDQNVSALGTVASDVWVVNPGGSNSEKVTVSSLDTVNNALNISALANNHVAGEMVVMYSGSGGTVAMPHTGGTLDGNVTLSGSAPGIDVIAVGMTDGTNWYRAFWGDPSWVPPYGTSAKWMGRLTLPNNAWAAIHAKASEIGVYAKGSPAVTVTGLEMAVYAASGTKTVYFDAHRAGFAGHRNSLPAHSVGSRAVRTGTLKRRHLDLYQHSSAHHHNDVTFWQTSDQLYWTSGSINLASGIAVVINGGTQANPNTGVSAKLAGQTHCNDNYVVLNTTGSPMTIYDPGISANVTIPAYSASGGTGGQTTGFGVLSGSFNWQARQGGGTASLGPPTGLVEIGKFDHTTDPVSGQYPLKTRHGSGLIEAQHIRDGGIAGKHMNWQVVYGPAFPSLNVSANSIAPWAFTLSPTLSQSASMMPGGWQIGVWDSAIGLTDLGVVGQAMGYVTTYANWPTGLAQFLYNFAGTISVVVSTVEVTNPQGIGGSSSIILTGQVANFTAANKTPVLYVRWLGLSTS